MRPLLSSPLFSFGVCLLLLALRSAVVEAACPTTPLSWEAEDCLVEAGTVTVCTYTPATSTWTCDVSGAAGPSNVVVVTDLDTAANDLEAWGDWNGELFCCELTGNDAGSAAAVKVLGSDYNDTLSFTWLNGSAISSDWDPPR